MGEGRSIDQAIERIHDHSPQIKRIMVTTAFPELKEKLLSGSVQAIIDKPFDNDELAVRVKNLIEQRKKLRERFTIGTYLHANEITVTSRDEKFLSKSVHIIVEHLSDPNFGVTQFSKRITY